MQRVGVLRALAVIGALVVTSWFVVGAQQARNLDAATALINRSPTLTAAQARRGLALLHAAGELNPDREVALLRGQLEGESGHQAQARRTLAAVTRAEPLNPFAWYIAARFSGGRTAIVAFLHLARLVPQLPARR